MRANAIVFIWGGPFPGREQKALQLFNEVNQFYAQKKQKGEIDSYESVVFDDFSSELSGFTIIHGDPDKLDDFSQSDESVGFGHRAQLLLNNFRMVRAFVGEGIQGRMANYAKQVAEILK